MIQNPISAEHEGQSEAAQPKLLRHSLREGGPQYGARFAEQYTVINLAGTKRVVLLLTPSSRGAVRDQAIELLAILRNLLGAGNNRILPTVQTIFLRDPGHKALIRELFQEAFGSEMPVTNFVAQPPCSGAALALEFWGIRGASVSIERPASNVAIVRHDGLKWLHASADGADDVNRKGTFEKAETAFRDIDRLLGTGGASYRRVVRAWFYMGGINEADGSCSGTTRYAEFNRARNEFYAAAKLDAASGIHGLQDGYAGYPASTGIGMEGNGLVVNCLALDSERPDDRLITLENPDQTPAYAYDAQHAPHAPRFSRAMALVAGHFVTTWISGTASIRDAESVFPGDIERQTQQTFDNIERLIARENFARYGARDAGARLRDLAKVRVYLKRPGDYAACKRTCEKRIPGVPAVYVLADVCRPELLVEIEAVAFSEASNAAKTWR